MLTLFIILSSFSWSRQVCAIDYEAKAIVATDNILHICIHTRGWWSRVSSEGKVFFSFDVGVASVCYSV